MEQLWTDDPDIIEQEFHNLKEQKTPVTFAQKKSQANVLRVAKLSSKEKVMLVSFAKSDPFPAEKRRGFFFYRPTPFLTRMFEAAPIKNDDQSLTIILPQQIKQIPRRKHPRVNTPFASRAVFALPGSTSLMNCQLLDVSLEGALLSGRLPPFVGRDIIIGPITLTLNLHSGAENEFTIQIPEARIVRHIKRNGGLVEIAIHFTLEGPNLLILENYVDWRAAEEE